MVLEQLLDGHRDLGVFTVSYYATISSTTRRGWVLQTFIMPDVSHHGFAGQTLLRKFSLHNDVFQKAHFALDWRLAGPGGEEFDKGRFDRDMTSADLQRGDLAIHLPKVDKRTTATLDLHLTADGKFVYGEQRDIDIFPQPPEAAPTRTLARQVVLYDPSGKTSELLTREGVKFEKADAIEYHQPDLQSKPELCWQKVFVIGQDALTAANATDVGRLERFVNDGGNLLVLAQSVTPDGLPARTSLEPREWASQLLRARERPSDPARRFGLGPAFLGQRPRSAPTVPTPSPRAGPPCR